MTDKTPLERLRAPFPPEVVGILPKPYKADSPKGQCNVCNGYHGLPAVHLDYVGHAAVTDRLLSVDPAWSWEPVATDQYGSPALDKDGNLWIRLTVCGVTRPGVGDGKSMKERVGDAIRNSAMRFGVALDLWTKDELESSATEGINAKPVARGKSQLKVEAQPTVETSPTLRTEDQSRKLWTLAGKVWGADKDVTAAALRAWLGEDLGREVESTKTLTRTEAGEAITHLAEMVPTDGPNIPSAS
jgi:hypothetical protein